MQAVSDCIPCMLEEALRVARRVTDDPWIHRKLLFAVMEYLPTVNFERSPAELSFDCLRFATKYLGVVDPYKEEKELHTAKLLACEHEVRQRILAAPDRLRAAIGFTLAASMLDLGAVDGDPVAEQLARDASALELAIDDYDELSAALAEARSVVYVLDNAGEVVCDKLVIEQLNVPDVACVVRKAPIMNEVTREDVEAMGLGRLAKIVDPGVDALGVPLSLCSAEFRALFSKADVVITKGQANYETLEEAERVVFHMLRAKCEYNAAHLGVRRGDAIVVRTPRDRQHETAGESQSQDKGDQPCPSTRAL